MHTVCHTCASAYAHMQKHYRKRVLDEGDDEDFVLHKFLARIVARHLRLQYCKARPAITQTNTRARKHTPTHPPTHTHTHTHKYTYDYGRNCNTHLPQTHKKRTRQHRHRHKTHTHPPTHTSAHVSLRDTRVRTCRCIGAWESARPAHWHARSEQRRHAEGTDGAMARVSSSRRTC